MALVDDVLEYLIDRMQIEEEWTVRGERSLTWWPSSMAQRVWASPARDFQGVELTTLHIETDLLVDVHADASTWERLAGVNRFASLSAYVADASGRAIHLHSSVSMTSDNMLMARALALHAMALQAADAHAEADELAAAFGAAVAASAHPSLGTRSQPDEMVGITEVYQQRGEGPSPFTSQELAHLVHLEPRPWALASNQLHQLEADLDFATDLPARLELDAAEEHPSLGSGLQLRLLLPVEADPLIAQKLNASERLEPDAHQLGAWCVDPDRGLLFSGFIPAAAYMPGLSRALVYHLSARNEWARALLFPAG
jgi:hypothetical protein